MPHTRRNFLKITTTAAAGLLICPRFASRLRSQPNQQADQLPKPTPAQQRWQDAEIGVIYHFDLPIAARRFAPNNTVRETLDPHLYHPEKLDTDQWLEAAKAAGANYAVFTATHFNGFMQWQSDLYPYSLKHTRWRNGKADVVEDFVNSCHKAGIKPGIYFSTHRNAYWSVWGHYVNWGKGRGTAKQAAFNDIAEKMTAELCSRYGPLIQIWYDAGVLTPAEGGPNVLSLFERYQPDSVFYHNLNRADFRWIGNEEGYAGTPCWATMPGGNVSHRAKDWKPILATGDPSGSVWSPGMVDVPLRGANGVHNWFWHPNQDNALHSTEALVQMYYESVGRNCNFVIGEVVTPEGLVPRGDIDRLAAFGRKVRERFGKSIAETNGTGHVLELKLPRPRRIIDIVLMEEISGGERIRAYEIQGLAEGGNWQLLCSGQSVGHKRIERFESVKVSAVKLHVTESIAEPKIRTFAVFAD